tara:strand:+ start:344 stop:958 length:615 start_codon:yes stop_codon:yes gene_type:complete
MPFDEEIKYTIEFIDDKYPIFVIPNLFYAKIDKLKEKIHDYRIKTKNTNIKDKNKVYHPLISYKKGHIPNFYHENIDEFNEINDYILKICETIIKNFEGDETNLKIYDMWVNFYEKGDYISEHNHSYVDYACCYYVDLEGDSSPILFSPISVNPKNDMLILFDARIFHSVPTTTGKRINIAMNLNRCSIPSKILDNVPNSFTYT